MTELKAGTRGTWKPRKTPAIIVGDGPDRFGQLAIKDVDGEYCVIDETDFTPDPEPPTTVMVEMSVTIAREIVQTGIDWRLAKMDADLVRAAAEALKKAGLG